jgi:hypothetical protein
LGVEFSRSSFLRTPLNEITFIVNSWYDEQKRCANIQSISTAKLTQVVLSTAAAFGGSKEPTKTQISDFLPFELDKEASEIESNTKKILSKLIKRGSIPTHVIAALHSQISLD